MFYHLQFAADAIIATELTNFTELTNSDEWKGESGIDDVFHKMWLPHKKVSLNF
jgi:hypothetical protein